MDYLGQINALKFQLVGTEERLEVVAREAWEGKRRIGEMEERFEVQRGVLEEELRELEERRQGEVFRLGKQLENSIAESEG